MKTRPYPENRQELIVNILWHVGSGWATENANGNLCSYPTIVLLDDISGLTPQIQEKIKKEIRNYEKSQEQGELIRNGMNDSISILLPAQMIITA